MKNEVSATITVTVKGDVYEVKNENLKVEIFFACANGSNIGDNPLSHTDNIFVCIDGHIHYTVSDPSLIRYIAQSIYDGSIDHEDDVYNFNNKLVKNINC